MTLFITFIILIVLAILCFLILKIDSRFIVANSIYNAINELEARLANLQHYSTYNQKFNVQMHYLSNVAEFDNSKPIIVLLHGFSADKYIWNRISRKLNTEYQLFTPDLLGHGDVAYRSTDNYSVPEQVRFLMDMLDKLNIQKFHIIGNSMGAFMTAKIVELCPTRVHKSVLIDPAGIRSDYSLQMAKSTLNPFEHYNESDFFDFYDLLMAKPPYSPKFILRAVADKYIGKREQYAHMFRDFFNPDDFFDVAHKIDASDVMLIWGKNDKLVPVADYKVWQKMLGSQTVIYDDLGHMPMVEDVTKVSRDIMSFLDRTA